jgi:hypothetical protein
LPGELYLFQTEKILENFSHRLTQIKNQANETNDIGKRELAKLNINALYGKIGSRYFRYDAKFVNISELKKLKSDYTKYQTEEINSEYRLIIYRIEPSNLNPKIRENNKEKYKLIVEEYNQKISKSFSNIAIASSIASRARRFLFNRA